MHLAEHSSPDAGEYPSVVRLAGEVGGEKVSVSGTLLPRKGPALVEVLGREIEIPFGERMLLILHEDLPGAIGRVGTFLGERGVGIADLVVGRPDGGPTGVMALLVDRRLGDADLAGLRSLDCVSRAWAVDLS